VFSTTATLVIGRTYQLLKRSVGLHQALELNVRSEQEEKITPQETKTVIQLQEVLPLVQVS